MSRPLLLNHFITYEYHDPCAHSVVTVCFDASNAVHVILWGGMGWICLSGIMLLPSWGWFQSSSYDLIWDWRICYISFMTVSWLVDSLFVSTCTWGGLDHTYISALYMSAGLIGVSNNHTSVWESQKCAWGHSSSMARSAFPWVSWSLAAWIIEKCLHRNPLSQLALLVKWREFVDKSMQMFRRLCDS